MQYYTRTEEPVHLGETVAIFVAILVRTRTCMYWHEKLRYVKLTKTLEKNSTHLFSFGDMQDC